ncbi:MAG: lysine 2,3-aminomutase [Desulfobacterales bacterium SG8_35_2]|nr:MAG: lysine 2,3-aminomutase [Desulfobacterales bacterium SG8_35_2]
MKHWQVLLHKSITQPAYLFTRFGIVPENLDRVTAIYPMRINPYYLGLIKQPGDPLWRQVVPDRSELGDTVCMEDPLNEENLSPVPNLVHKYPDRALFLVHNQCAVYCRFCTRKRKVGTKDMVVSNNTITRGIKYLQQTPAIKDVLVSGGDPLLLDDNRLDYILSNLRAIKHIDIIRIGSRVPCTLPMRVTKKLAATIKRYHPVYINTHFNHPDEITPEAARACNRLADAGIPLGSQTVLLKGINDDPEIIKRLLYNLLRIRVKPYYLFQTDMTKGTNHFRTPIARGLEIMHSLIGHVSGMAVPTFAVDAPGGGGKIPLVPSFVKETGRKLVFQNYCGATCTYDNPEE